MPGAVTGVLVVDGALGARPVAAVELPGLAEVLVGRAFELGIPAELRELLGSSVLLLGDPHEDGVLLEMEVLEPELREVEVEGLAGELGVRRRYGPPAAVHKPSVLSCCPICL